jgi:exosortase E/protease (VPEID-CTERM system)
MMHLAKTAVMRGGSKGKLAHGNVPGPAAGENARRLGLSLAIFLVLAAAQAVAVSYLFVFSTGLDEWSDPVAWVKRAARLALLAVVALIVVNWPHRTAIASQWAAARANAGRRPILVNALTFGALLAATLAFSRIAARSPETAWLLFWPYCALLVINGSALIAVAAPLPFLARFAYATWPRLAAALGCAVLVLVAAQLSLATWDLLSPATLRFAAALLAVYESDIVLNVAQRELGVGSFSVIVAPICSGYEGIGLVTAFLGIYLWTFRDQLRFPNALAMLPIGIAAIWLLNALRISALISIGAHLSPDVAIDGFHSQAGAIAFLAVAVGLMMISHRSGWFSIARYAPARRAAQPADRLHVALLAPFVALMAATLVAPILAPYDQWLYGLRIIAVGLALWVFHDVYAGLAQGVSPLALACGAGIGLAWVATDPLRGSETALGLWLASLPPAAMAAWLCLRAIGSVLIAPVAEELAFRGYLQRALISWRFETVPQGQLTPLAFLVPSLLFGIMHERWLAGALAGAAYALLTWTRGRLSDAVGAHMASNAVIMLWAVAARQWSLL